MSEPREWWVSKLNQLTIPPKAMAVRAPPTDQLEDWVHVIEKSDYDRVCKERDALKRALAYAKEEIHLEFCGYEHHSICLEIEQLERGQEP
jgi:hypothetical protein